MRALLGALLPTLLILATSPAYAAPADKPGDASVRPPAPGLTLDGAFIRHLDTDMDGGGSFERSRFELRAGARRELARGLRLGLALRYRADRYSFSGGGFAAPGPWKEVDSLRLGATVTRKSGERWTLMAVPSVRLAAEPGALFNEAATVGLIAGLSFRRDRALSIGSGVALFTQLEDDPRAFPFLFFNWQVSERLGLGMGRSPGASGGAPGLSLSWKASKGWTLAAGAGYERLRFRLDGEGAAPGGVGEDRGARLFASAEWSLTKGARLSVTAGAKLAGRVSLEGSNGELIDEADYDTAPFAGIRLSGRL